MSVFTIYEFLLPKYLSNCSYDDVPSSFLSLLIYLCCQQFKSQLAVVTFRGSTYSYTISITIKNGVTWTLTAGSQLATHFRYISFISPQSSRKYKICKLQTQFLRGFQPGSNSPFLRHLPLDPPCQLPPPLFKIFVSPPLFSVLPPNPSCPNLTNQTFLV